MRVSLFQRYFLVINICKEAPVDSLVRHITSRKISKASVIAERELGSLWFLNLAAPDGYL